MAGVVLIVVGALTDRIDYALYAGGGVFVVFLLFAILGFRKYILIENNTFTYHSGNTEYSFPIQESEFKCIRRRDREDKDIYVTYNGKETYLDCSFLTFFQYHALLEDLNVTGEGQTPVKLPTKK